MCVPSNGLTLYLKTNRILGATPPQLAAVIPLITLLLNHVLHHRATAIILPPGHRVVAVEATHLHVLLGVAHQVPQVGAAGAEGNITKT